MTQPELRRRLDSPTWLLHSRVTFAPQDALFNSLLDDPYLSLQLGGKPPQPVSGDVIITSSWGVWPPDPTL